MFWHAGGNQPSLGLPGSPCSPWDRAGQAAAAKIALPGLGWARPPPRWEQKDGHLCPQGGISLLLPPAGMAPIWHWSPGGEGTHDSGMARGRGQGAERAAAVPDPWAERFPAPQPPAPLPPTLAPT